MPQVSPFMKLFLALLVVLVGLFGWQRIDMAALETRLGERFDERFIAMEARFDERFIAMEARFDERFTRIDERLDRLEAGQSGLRERMTRLETRFERLEAGQSELRERMARLETGQSELRERTARIEGTVAGALSRPGTLAQAVENDEASAN